MTTYILHVDDLIEILQEWKKEGYQYVVASTDPYGGWSAPSKRKPFYAVGFAISRGAFANDDLRNLFNARGLVLFAFNDISVFSEKAKKIFEENGKEGKE